MKNELKRRYIPTEKFFVWLIYMMGERRGWGIGVGYSNIMTPPPPDSEQGLSNRSRLTTL